MVKPLRGAATGNESKKEYAPWKGAGTCASLGRDALSGRRLRLLARANREIQAKRNSELAEQMRAKSGLKLNALHQKPRVRRSQDRRSFVAGISHLLDGVQGRHDGALLPAGQHR